MPNLEVAGSKPAAPIGFLRWQSLVGARARSPTAIRACVSLQWEWPGGACSGAALGAKGGVRVGRSLAVFSQEAPHQPRDRHGARLPTIGRQSSRQLVPAAENLDVLDRRALGAVAPFVALHAWRDAADRRHAVTAVMATP